MTDVGPGAKADNKDLSRDFRGIKPVCALDLFHGLLDRAFVVAGMLTNTARTRAVLTPLPIVGDVV